MSDGFKFYQLEVENWRNSHHRKGHRSTPSKDKDKDGQANSSTVTKSSTVQDSVASTAQSQIEQYSDLSVSKELSNGRRYTLPYINGQDSGLAAIVDDSSPVSSPTISTRRLSFERQPSVTSSVFRRPALSPISSSSTTNSKQQQGHVASSAVPSNTFSAIEESHLPKPNTERDTDDASSAVDQSTLIWAAQE